MSTERQQQAVGYVRVATGEEIGTGAQVERHKHTIISHCLDSGLKLTHMIIDIGGRAGRGGRWTSWSWSGLRCWSCLAWRSWRGDRRSWGRCWGITSALRRALRHWSPSLGESTRAPLRAPGDRCAALPGAVRERGVYHA